MSTTILGVHGGAWVEGSIHDMDSVLKPFLDLGYTAGSVNYPLRNVPKAVSYIRSGINFEVDQHVGCRRRAAGHGPEHYPPVDHEPLAAIS